MTKLTRSQPQSIRLPALSNETLEQLQRIEATALVAKVGLEEVSEIYTYGEYKAIHSLTAADLCRKTYELSGGKLTPAEEESYTALRQQYLDQMRAISQITGSDVIRTIAHGPRPRQSRSFLDLLRGD